MFRVGEVEGSLVDARVLENVEVSGEQGEGNGAGDVDAGVFELPFDVEGDGDEAGGGGLGEVSGPLVDAYGADDLLGLCDLVHLGQGDRGRQGCGAEDYAEEKISHSPISLLNEIRRYLRGKVLLRGLWGGFEWVGLGSVWVGGFGLVFEAWVRRRCWM